jgi:hypothetical protein
MFVPYLLFHVEGAGVDLHELTHWGIVAFVVTSFVLEAASIVLARRGRLAGADGRLGSAAWSVIVVAACSIGSAAIHLAVIEDHLREYALFGVAFALLAAFQIAWPVVYLRRRQAWLAVLAIGINLGAALVWLWSRTLGLPIGPTPGVPEAVGAADVISTGLELTLVGLLVLGLSARARGIVGRLRLPAARVWVAGGYALGAVALATFLALLSLGGASAT